MPTFLAGMESSFMPHGMCYLWTPGLLWLHAGSDTLIALAYIVIPLVLLYIVVTRTKMLFNWMAVLFGIFIIACGATHVMAVWNIWNADYWVSGGVKLVTAIASVATAILLVRLVPRIREIPTHGEMREANERLADAYRELEQFSYAVSHDLRAPLRAVDGYGKALEDSLGNDLDEKSVHYLKRMREASTRMGDLIDDLLALSQLSQEHVTHKTVDLSAMAHEVADELTSAYPDRAIRFVIHPDMFVLGDPSLLRSMLMNLVGNAIKFTANREQADIEIGCEKMDEGPVYFVRDNGAGFDERYADKLFAVFQRLHTTDEFTGNGVGLASVQRIVHRHGGRIWAHGEVDKGATFFFTLEGTAHG